MSTLQNIRNRSGLLVAVIGIAMLAFILGDFMQSKRSGGREIESEYAGKVLGEDVSRKDYEVKVDERITNWKNDPQQHGWGELTNTIKAQLRSEVWDQHVRELIMNNEYSKLGIDVSDEEWTEKISGVNVHPEISKIPTFQDPETGKFNGNNVRIYLNNIEQSQNAEAVEAKRKWVTFKKYLIALIKNEKYNALVAKALYVTNEEAKVSFNEKSQNVTFNLVTILLTSVADSIVKPPTESEIKTYYTKHKEIYKQKAARDVDFVVFTVVPSAEDDVATKFSLEDLKADFDSSKDYDKMARKYSDNTARFTFATKEQLGIDTNWTKLFAAEEGTVIGPYQVSQGVYRIAKLAVSQNRPDSVEARHIFIKQTQTMDRDSVQTRIEVIKAQVEAGTDFGFLAKENSEDKAFANTEEGNLGWFSEGAMVNKFNINPKQNSEIDPLNPVFQTLEDTFNVACFESEIGDLSVVNSLFGIHLIEITNRSNLVPKVKIAFIDKKVEPSPATVSTYYSQAAEFTGKILNEGIAFESLALLQNILIESDNNVTPDRQSIKVRGVDLPDSRKMVKWMNTAEQGALSEIYEFENQYVVAFLKKIYAEGVTPLEDIKERIFDDILKENKAAHIIANIQATDDLATIAANHGQAVVSAQSAKLSNSSYDPKLVGSIFGTPVGSISKPIEGSNAVYVIEVTAQDDEKTSGDFTQQKQQIQKRAAAYAKQEAYKALKTDADVKDNLSVIY